MKSDQADPRIYVRDILTAIGKIDVRIVGMSESEFLINDVVSDSVIRQLEIVGEAVRRLDQDWRQKYPQLPWKKMVGMRDVLIHGYDEVDLVLVWRLVSGGLDDARVELEKILNE